jgi:ADP-heptose:LPS heptosyltransferase
MGRRTLEQHQTQPHSGSRERVLVFLKGGIGDVVFSLPLLADLRAGFPASELIALSHDQGRDVLAYSPAVDVALSYGPMGQRSSVGGWLAALGGGSVEVAVTPVRSLRAAWFLARTRASVRVGFGGGPERLLLTHAAAPRPFEVVFSRRFERLAQALQLSTGAPGRLEIPAEDRERAGTRLRAAGWEPSRRLVALHVGGGWPTKQWPVEHARGLVRALAGRGHQTLLLGGSADTARAADISRGSEGNVVSRIGTAVREALAELSLAEAAVGVDSGLSHAGVALGIPTVLLFGPNDPASVAPAPLVRIVTQPLPCRPCNRAGKRRCPLGHHRCMRETTPEQVLSAVDALTAW